MEFGRPMRKRDSCDEKEGNGKEVFPYLKSVVLLAGHPITTLYTTLAEGF